MLRLTITNKEQINRTNKFIQATHRPIKTFIHIYQFIVKGLLKNTDENQGNVQWLRHLPCKELTQV